MCLNKYFVYFVTKKNFRKMVISLVDLILVALKQIDFFLENSELMSPKFMEGGEMYQKINRRTSGPVSLT